MIVTKVQTYIFYVQKYMSISIEIALSPIEMEVIQNSNNALFKNFHKDFTVLSFPKSTQFDLQFTAHLLRSSLLGVHINEYMNVVVMMQCSFLDS